MSVIMREIFLILLGGASGAVVSWIGNMINNAINHKKEIQRLTYSRKLESSENAMGVIGMMRDQLAPIILWGRKDLTPQNQQEFTRRCDELSHYLNSTLTEIYKLYLYFDFKKLEKKYKLEELMPLFVDACDEIMQLNQSICEKTLSADEWHEAEFILRQYIKAKVTALELVDQYFADVVEILKNNVSCYCKH